GRSHDELPFVNVPTTCDGWKITPERVPPATGLASAVVLPDGEPLALLFADPARAKAAILLAKVSVPRKQGAKTSVTVEWLAIDLKTGAIVATTPLLTHEFVWDSDGYLPPVLSAGVLSPSGDRLAGGGPAGQGWG